MYLVSVYFDKITTKRIQTLIDQIALTSGNHYMIEKQVPPHMTLSAIEARSVDLFIPTIKQLENKLYSGTIHFV